ncbi:MULTISPECIES: 2Fe-2S iron-sulfur cluster-binding protein [unclassified Nonomuraea]|uniref:2Fe-2S iron-sulfur cluster-binding protein n=1 Tax=unclassified Nonomuraea TaxID=2593643 RepID=UPI0033EC7B18
MSGHIPIHLNVNGQVHELSLDPRVTLLDCLREHLGLTGTKKGCDQGACGACTVIADGERINSCLTPAVQCDGMEIVTIEAMASHELGAKVQDAFLAYDGLQCGYCTSGQICSSVAMLAEHRDGRPSAVTEDLAGPAPLTDVEVRERMAGNLCRCGAYNGIVAAIRKVARP